MLFGALHTDKPLGVVRTKLTMPSNKLEIFRKEFLNANSWSQRKGGVPLDLLDNLTNQELEIAENELIENLDLKDD